MTIEYCLKSGQLQEALEIALAEVKASPMAWDKRVALSQILCLTGDFQRADNHLETAQMQSPDALMRLSMYRQMIRGEVTRRECWLEGRSPELLQDPSPLIELNLKLCLALRENDEQAAAELAEQIEDARPPLSGTCDGIPFEDFRDQDDRSSFFFEVITSNGKYFWVPMDSVVSVQFHAVEEPCDLIWRRATMEAAGQDGEVFIPALYVGTADQQDVNLRLGRETRWPEEEGSLGVGLGQRMFWLGEDEKPILEMTKVEFTSPE